MSLLLDMECFFPALPWLSDENQLRVPLFQAISMDARCGFVNTHPKFEWFQHWWSHYFDPDRPLAKQMSSDWVFTVMGSTVFIGCVAETNIVPWPSYTSDLPWPCCRLMLYLAKFIYGWPHLLCLPFPSRAGSVRAYSRFRKGSWVLIS